MQALVTRGSEKKDCELCGRKTFGLRSSFLTGKDCEVVLEMIQMKSNLPAGKQKRRFKTTVTSLLNKPSAAEFKLRLRERFWVRVHMALMLAGVILAGVGFSKLLLELGVKTMAVRYPAAIIVSYGVFFLLVKLWLWYVGIYAARSSTRGGNWGLDLSGADFSSTSGSSGASWSGFGGGNSGGGGANDGWGESLSLSSGGSSRDLGGGSWFDFGFDWGDDGEGGCLGVLLLLLLLGSAIVLLGWGVGGGIYLIYQAPAILVEAAFEAALAAGLVRATRGMGGSNWRSRLFKATWKQFVAMLVLALGVGLAARHWCPAAMKLADLWRAC